MYEPSTSREAIELLAAFGSDGHIYAGGTELLLLMKEGLARFAHLVNIKTIAGLDTVACREGRLEIGSAVTHRMLEHSAIVRELLPCLSEMSANIANVRVRNVGTIGGNLCFAEPHSDPATLLLIYDAVLEICGLKGYRSVPAREFILGPLETALEDCEILTQIRVTPLPKGMKASYLRLAYYERPSIGVACAVGLSPDGYIKEVRLAVGSVGERPVRLDTVESLFETLKVAEAIALIPKAADVACDRIKPTSDLYGTEAYKRQLVHVFLERALQRACERR